MAGNEPAVIESLDLIAGSPLRVFYYLSVCGKQAVQEHIYGGANAMPGEWPWHASLSYLGKPFCGGSLISDSWVITAAHCFDGNSTSKDPKSWTVQLGFTKFGDVTENSAVNVTILKIVIPENYTNFVVGTDMALVKLSHPVAFTQLISPVCLPEKTHRFRLRSTCYATGLMNVSEEDKSAEKDVPEKVPLDSTRALHKLTIILVGWRTCNCIYNSYMKPELLNPTKPGMMCAVEHDEQTGPRLGDSGGPIVCNEDGIWFLAGIISFSAEFKLHDTPTIVTAVSFYQEWIQNNVDTDASFAPQNITVTDDVDTDNCSDLLSTKNPGCGRILQIKARGSNDAGAWPWQVDLVNNGLHACGGALISDSWVITAAHCFTGPLSSDSPHGWTVIVAPGSPAMREISVQSISMHGAFISPEDGRDVALLQLAQPVNFGPYIQAVCLPQASNHIKYGSSCWHTGWDRPTVDGKTGPPRAVAMELIDPSQCNCIYSHPSSANHSMSILPGMICASNKEKEENQCLSDSGGPLVCQEDEVFVLVGLQSFGGKCQQRMEGDTILPGVFTQLITYEDWMYHVTNDNSLNLQPMTTYGEVDNERCPINLSRGCGYTISSPGSVPNNNATEGSWPWLVSIQRYQRHACSGAVIAQTWVLTSAHCMFSYKLDLNDDYTVILGRQSQNGPNHHEVTRKVRRVVIHPEYNQTSGKNDLALIEVYYDVTFSDYIQPICLPPEDIKPPSTGCWVTGWEIWNPPENKPASPLIQELEVSLLVNEKCGDQGNKSGPNQDTQLCAAKINEKDFTCLKESSAPLVCQLHPGGPWFLFGIGISLIKSRGYECPAKYTPMPSKLSWVREVVPHTEFDLVKLT
ncbi:serine protease 53-like [Pelobates fuscus]|uniref:serine protease 53-like n=1 Tax=Pelobates fuscus TaxID=191477 RepID=UPI002FE49F49